MDEQLEKLCETYKNRDLKTELRFMSARKARRGYYTEQDQGFNRWLFYAALRHIEYLERLCREN